MTYTTVAKGSPSFLPAGPESLDVTQRFCFKIGDCCDEAMHEHMMLFSSDSYKPSRKSLMLHFKFQVLSREKIKPS